ncbi:hypothetical protein, partial [Chryseobacterium viscerum]
SYMSFGVKADGANVGWLSSSGEASLAKTAVTVGNEGFSFLSAPSQQIAIDSPVSMNEIMRITNNGNVGLGRTEPKEKLDVFGNILTGSDDSVMGINAFAIRYVKGSLNNWGSLRSSSSSYMSFGVKADGANVGWLSSSGEASLAKTAVT